MKRTSKKPLSRFKASALPASEPLACGRPLVIGDVVEFHAAHGLRESPWSRIQIQTATLGMPGLEARDFGKTWRWVQTDRLPSHHDPIEIYDVAQGWRRTHRDGGGTRYYQNAGRVEYFHVAFDKRPFTAADEGPWWRWPQVDAKPVAAPPAQSNPELLVGSLIELQHADGTWRPATVDGLYVAINHFEIGNSVAVRPNGVTANIGHHGAAMRRAEDPRQAQRFSVKGVPGTMPIIPLDEQPRWRWPSTTPVPEAVTPPKLTISLEDHCARLFAKNFNNAMNAVAALNRLQTLRTLIVRSAHTVAAAITEQSKDRAPFQENSLVFSRNVFFAAMEATEQLQKQNAVMRQTVQHLDDCYKSMSARCTALFARAEMRNFVEREMVGADPECVKVWRYALQVWEAIDPEAAKWARLCASNLDEAELLDWADLHRTGVVELAAAQAELAAAKAPPPAEEGEPLVTYANPYRLGDEYGVHMRASVECKSVCIPCSSNGALANQLADVLTKARMPSIKKPTP